MPFTRVIHYSGQAGRARKAAIAGHEPEFEAFKSTVSFADLLGNAERVLLDAGVSPRDREHILLRLSKAKLSESRRQLIFIYKMAFEATSLRRAKSRAV